MHASANITSPPSSGVPSSQMARSGQNTRTASAPVRSQAPAPVSLIDDTAASQLLARAVKARMGKLLAADAGHPSAELRDAEAGVYVTTLADLSGRQSSAVSLEVEKRALARIRAVEEGRDLDQAELEAAGRPHSPAEDSVDWRQAEVLRTLVRLYNERADRRGVMAGMRAAELVHLLKGTVPKTVVAKALRVLHEHGFANQYGPERLWIPTALGADAVGETLAKTWYFSRFEEPKTLDGMVEEIVEHAADSRHSAARERAHGDHEDAAEYDARAAAWLDVAVIASGEDEAAIEQRIQAHVAALVERDRERQEKTDERTLKNTIVDANDQLHPRELEVLRSLVSSHNHSVASWNQTMEDAGPDEQIAGRRVRDLRIQPSVRTDELVWTLKGSVPKSAVKKALTRLHETNLISYRFDAGMGGYWLVNRSAFAALGVDPVEFDEY